MILFNSASTNELPATFFFLIFQWLVEVATPFFVLCEASKNGSVTGGHYCWSKIYFYLLCFKAEMIQALMLISC